MTGEKIVKMDELNFKKQKNNNKHIILMNLTRDTKKNVKMDEITIELTVIEYDRTANTIKRE